jgi:hypothetical protein
MISQLAAKQIEEYFVMEHGCIPFIQGGTD